MAETPKETILPRAEIVLRGKRIREDANGLVCLDDIWQVAKSTPGRQPRRWRDIVATKRLEEALQQKIVVTALKENTPVLPVAYAKRGRGNAGTFAHPILAAAYAGFLSPKLEIEVREVWLRYRRGDATLADEILQRAPPADNVWAGVRALARARRVSYTNTLRDHGVVNDGYWRCTNAVYRKLLGNTASNLRAERGLPPKANLRDGLATDELSYVMAAEVLATERIEEEDRQGNSECEYASARSAGFIRRAIEEDRKDRQRPLLKSSEPPA
ncbi:MAG TPA: KilA-N domain-containing protein [Stellaceae bacterium]|nr:KilA-N domain-containing protein [Stellaceae bacterium]